MLNLNPFYLKTNVLLFLASEALPFALVPIKKIGSCRYCQVYNRKACSLHHAKYCTLLGLANCTYPLSLNPVEARCRFFIGRSVSGTENLQKSGTAHFLKKNIINAGNINPLLALPATIHPLIYGFLQLINPSPLRTSVWLR